MVITKLEQMQKQKGAAGKASVRSSKVKVYLDGDYAFFLYQRDIADYDLAEGMELKEDILEKLKETVFQRSKEKVLSLLGFMDRTEQELKVKLKDSGYPDEIIQKTIGFVTEYGFLNDKRYALNYIRHRKETRSRAVLAAELMAKGIGREISADIFTKEYDEPQEDPEITALRKAIHKKVRDTSSLTWEEKQKLMGHLYRKGFSPDKIRKSLE